jgi:hypothetical protein
MALLACGVAHGATYQHKEIEEQICHLHTESVTGTTPIAWMMSVRDARMAILNVIILPISRET